MCNRTLCAQIQEVLYNAILKGIYGGKREGTLSTYLSTYKIFLLHNWNLNIFTENPNI